MSPISKYYYYFLKKEHTIKLAVQGGDGKAWALRSNYLSPQDI